MTKDHVRILVVDDDPYLLELLVETLDTIGYQCTSAKDGLEALDLLQKSTYDLVVTDIKMPGMDGISLLRKIRRRFHDLPVLFITGVASPQVIGQVEPDGLLAKPFRIAHIENMIETALKEKTAGHARPFGRVLIVDDDASERETLSELFTHHQYVPFAVDDITAAQRELEYGKIDVVLLTHHAAPQERRFLKEVRSQYPQVKIVLRRGPETATGDKTPNTDRVVSTTLPPEDILKAVDEAVFSDA